MKTCKKIIVSILKIDDAVNQLLEEGFDIDKCEHAYDTVEYPMWIVLGYKE